MSTIVDTGLSSKAVVGRFYRRLEEIAQRAWWTKLSMHFASSQESESYRWLGMVPQVRQWVGGRRARPVRSQAQTIVNKTWESTIRIDADEFRRDKTGQIMVRVNELAQRVAMHPNKLISTLMVSGQSQTVYDGQFFFDTDHNEGDSGVQSNSIVVDISAPTNPTETQMYDGITRGIQQLLGLKDDQGEPINENARSFLVMIPPSFLAATLTAISGKQLANSSNPLVEGPFAIDWVANPRLTWTDRFAVYRTDGDARPFIFQEELPVQMQVVAEGSELEINENVHQYGVKAVHECGFGFWQSACLITFT